MKKYEIRLEGLGTTWYKTVIAMNIEEAILEAATDRRVYSGQAKVVRVTSVPMYPTPTSKGGKTMTMTILKYTGDGKNTVHYDCCGVKEETYIGYFFPDATRHRKCFCPFCGSRITKVNDPLDEATGMRQIIGSSDTKDEEKTA